MRLYDNFKEAFGEVARDIVEMGIKVNPKTYQDKVIEGKTEFETLEVQNYIYTVINPKLTDLNPIQPWADQEFEERISCEAVNPGEAWKTRPEVWTEFLNKDNKFHYTYNERIRRLDQLDRIIERLNLDSDSRQCFLSIWDAFDIFNLGGSGRIPCSLGYLFQIRGGALNMTYLMRSCDFFTHFTNDAYLALKLQHYVAMRLGIPVGQFTHWMASLHMYRKDSGGIF